MMKREGRPSAEKSVFLALWRQGKFPIKLGHTKNNVALWQIIVYVSGKSVGFGAIADAYPRFGRIVCKNRLKTVLIYKK